MTEFRVRKVGHADPAEVERELTAAEGDGFALDLPIAIGGDLVLLFSKDVAPAASTEASGSAPDQGGATA